MGMLYAEQELYGKAMSFLRKASAQYQLLNDAAFGKFYIVVFGFQ